MLNEFKDFIYDESGVETMEWIAIVVVAAILIAICARVGENVKKKTSNLATKI